MNTIQDATKINDLARTAFLKDGHHYAIALLKTPQGLVGVDVSQLMGHKDAVEERMVMEIVHNDASAIVFISEAWARMQKNPGKEPDEITRKVMDGKVRIADLPAEEKVETLMVSVESDDGLAVMFQNPIVRDAEGRPSLKAAEMLQSSQFEGRFSNLFQKAERIKEQAKKILSGEIPSRQD